MPHRYFCTYFDQRYLARGLALYESLLTNAQRFTLWVLALDETAEWFVRRLKLPHVEVIGLGSLESFDIELRAVRSDRSLVEYYFTCSPCFPRFLLETRSAIDTITYLDSDLYFFSSPEPIFRELGPSSVGITPHRFSAKAERTHGRFGKYNVGWLTFRRNDDGIRCLNWWREQCLAWCFDRVEGSKYADQGYLGEFESHFSGVYAIAHPGANLAPWNVASHRISCSGDAVLVDEEPLIFFHFQGLREIASDLYDSNLSGYGARLDTVAREHIFRPYLHCLRRQQAIVASATTLAPLGSGVRRPASGILGLRQRAGRYFYTLKAALAGNLVRM